MVLNQRQEEIQRKKMEAEAVKKIWKPNCPS